MIFYSFLHKYIATIRNSLCGKYNVADLRVNETNPIFLIYILKPTAQKTPFLVNIPIQKARTQLWHSLHPKNNPFVSTLIDYENGNINQFEGSVLDEYYQKHSPESAAGVLKLQSNDALMNISSYGFVLPWDNRSPETMIAKRERDARAENFHASGKKLGLNSGYTEFGPITKVKGQIEFDRLTSVYNSIKRRGYKEKAHADDGSISGYFLFNTNKADWCFIITRGKHRAYALAALGFTEIPVKVSNTLGSIVRDADAAYWPHVQDKLFTKEDALFLFNKIIYLK